MAPLAADQLFLHSIKHTAPKAYERGLRPYVRQKENNPAPLYIPDSGIRRVGARHRIVKLLAVPFVSKLVMKTMYGCLLRETFSPRVYESTNQRLRCYRHIRSPKTSPASRTGSPTLRASPALAPVLRNQTSPTYGANSRRIS